MLELETAQIDQPSPLVTGYGHPVLTVDLYIVTYTWIVLAILFVGLLVARTMLRKKDTFGQFVVVSSTNTLLDMARQALPDFTFSHFCFVATIFIFIFLCNVISLIPWIEEPTANPNTTLALGLTAFFYIQTTAIKTQGVWNYIKSYFAPFFLMMPLNVVGKLATVVSLSFRLFGNIFGGFLISEIYFKAIEGSFWLELGGIITGINLILKVFFCLFEGYLQAFVFTMLTLTYLAIAMQKDGGGH